MHQPKDAFPHHPQDPSARRVLCLCCDRTYLARSVSQCPYCRRDAQSATVGSDEPLTKKVMENDLFK